VRKQFNDALAYRRSLETYEEELVEYTKKLKEQVEKKKKTTTGKKDKPSSAPSAAEEKKKESAEKKPASKPTTSSATKKPRRPTRKPKLEVVLRALDRKMPVRVSAHRSSDILNALKLAESFSLDLILEGATEAYLVADEIAEAKAKIVLGRMDRDPFPRVVPFRRASPGIGAALNNAGIPWTVGSGAESASRARFVAWNAQLATAHAPSSDPLRTVTAEAARMLAVEKQIGQLRPGMLADIVLWQGDPLDPAGRVQSVYVGGEVVYEAAK
jgi:imidazolonepropionase-like amidohydrolase